MQHISVLKYFPRNQQCNLICLLNLTRNPELLLANLKKYNIPLEHPFYTLYAARACLVNASSRTLLDALATLIQAWEVLSAKF
jgi:hypothetical protein